MRLAKSACTNRIEHDLIVAIFKRVRLELPPKSRGNKKNQTEFLFDVKVKMALLLVVALIWLFGGLIGCDRFWEAFLLTIHGNLVKLRFRF